MNDIKLSICIPTYNRAPFLRYLLNTFVEQGQLPFRYELVISDNASTDDTAGVIEEFTRQGLPIRYLRRAVNGGSLANLANAFQHADGLYSIYLADDDLLIFPNLIEAVAFLDENEDVVACHAPWTLYDAVHDADTSQFYEVRENVKFRRHEFRRLFSFLFEGHIFPEICIYRTEKLRAIYVPRDFCFYAFAHVANSIDLGAVAFMSKPFYRSVTNSPFARDRAQAGHNEVLTSWDNYRGGLEYFLYLGFKRGDIDFTPEEKARYDQACQIFTGVRMVVAARFWLARKDYVKAYELYTRICYAGLEKHAEVQAYRESLPLMAGVQTLARKLNAISGLRCLVVDDIPDIAPLADLFKQLGLKDEIEVVDGNKRLSQADIGTTAVFTPHDVNRQKFIDHGHPAQQVYCEADIIAGLPI
ncbi:glycosyltransferase family 2 protein (plasmid) [Peteryoungia desertarenae]|uniref:Glycosyltransferase family 2 protein n=1 Tax=Peteryoungia desertarenae TaxID=1813451 RepID=A0ABX6QU83_9HYPH|nr:glycosyltransferase family 2 protein [Peteryoungia desertarenae]QLF71762.1 glycosyltransferase family 2 protein [Peteryoungia desertarenae]